MSAQSVKEERVFIVGLTEESSTIGEILGRAGFSVELYHDMVACTRCIEEGAGAVLVTEGSLKPEHVRHLVDVLEQQPPWSDLPIVIMVPQVNLEERGYLEALKSLRCSVTVLEQPMGGATLVSSLETILRARRRQYELRDLMEELSRKEQEEHARREEVEALLDNLPAGVWIARDPECQSLVGNKAGSEMLRVPAGTNISPGFFDSRGAHFQFHKDGRVISPQEWSLFQAARTGRPFYDDELQIVFEDNSSRWLFGNAVPLEGGESQIRGALAMFVDVTAHKEAETARARLAAIVENSGDAIVGNDLEGIVTSWNPAAERLFGWRADEVIGRSIDLVIPGEKREEETNILARVRQGEGVENRETLRVAKDGRVINVHVTITPVRDAAGQIAGMAKIIHDITDRKRFEMLLQRRMEELQGAKEEMAEQNQELLASRDQLEFERGRYQKLFDLAPDGYVVTDLRGRIQEVNREACRMFQKGSNFLYRLNLIPFFGREDKKRLRDLLEQFKQSPSEQPLRLEASLRPPQQAPIPCALTINAVTDPEGAVVGLRWLIRDVTVQKHAETALRQAEQEWKRTFDSVPDLIVILDEERRIKRVNRAMAQRLGCAPDECVGLPCQDCIRPAEWSVALPFTEETRLGAVEVHDKQWGDDYQLTMTRLLDEIGQPAGSVHVLRNVTQRKQAEESLRRSEQLRGLALDAAELGTWDWDLRANIVVADSRARALLGMTAGPLSYERVLQAVPSEDRSRWDLAAKEALKPGASGRYNLEHRVVWPNGAVKWLAAKGQAYFEGAGDQQRAVRFTGTVQDITGRIERQEALRANELALRRVARMLEMAPVLVLDAESKIIYWNRGAEVLYGFMGAEVMGRVAHELLQTRFPQPLAAIMAQLREGKDWRGELEHIRKDGARVFVVSSWAPYFNADGSFEAIIEANNDITERRDMERMLRQTKEELARINEGLEQTVQQRTARLSETVVELERFSYSITHDMRAPLRAIRSFSELLVAENCLAGCSAQGLEYLKRIMSAASRMDSLIVDALNFAKLVKGECALESVDVGALLSDILGSYPNLQAHQGEIHLEGEFPVVQGNEAALTQCFSNLLDNALKFVPVGKEPRVRVWAEERDGLIRIWFEDNGIGIPKDWQERIFKMFEKVNVGEGTGIGLALVHKAAERMGGAVGVESEEGKGSRFWIELRESSAVEARPAEPAQD